MSEVRDYVAEFIRQKLEERDRLKDLDLLDKEHEVALRHAIRKHGYDHGIIIQPGTEFDYIIRDENGE
jgi:hypothetical protein